MTIRWMTAAGLGALCILAAQAGAPSWNADKERQFDAYIADLLTATGAPGLTVGFATDSITWVKGYGFADLEHRVPASAQTAYRWASVTKPMTAVAALTLVQAGKLDLDANVQQYAPFYPEKRWPLTARRLLGHLGGVSHYRDYGKEGHIKVRKTTREAIAIFADWPLTTEPGTRFGYTSYGYNLLGAVIEGAAGLSYGAYMRQAVWEPLAMDDMRMDELEAIIPHRARGYRMVDGALQRSEVVDISSRFAAGGTRGTVPDILKFGKGMWRHRLLSPELTELMWTSMKTADRRYTRYGMGWNVGGKAGRFMVSHSGAQQETRTLFWVFPRKRLTMAVAFNFESGDRASALERLFETLTGEAHLPAYVGDAADRLRLRAMRLAFSLGAAELDRRGDFEGDAAAAFGFFDEVNELLTRGQVREARTRLNDGLHPVGDDALISLGAFMASALSRGLGPEAYAAARGRGFPAFFGEYVALSRKKGLPRFDRDFEDKAMAWMTAWEKAANPLASAAPAFWLWGPDQLRQKLEPFRGAAIAPDYSNALDGYAQYLGSVGKYAEILTVLQSAIETYPQVAGLHDSLGLFWTYAGQPEKAVAAYRRALALDPTLASAIEALERLEAKKQ